MQALDYSISGIHQLERYEHSWSIEALAKDACATTARCPAFHCYQQLAHRLYAVLLLLCRAIHESPLFQQPADSSLAPNCPAIQQQVNEQLLQFKSAASEVRGACYSTQHHTSCCAHNPL